MIVASWRDLKLCNAIKVLKGRGIAQLVERRSPKPQVPGSSPGAPATASNVSRFRSRIVQSVWKTR